MIQNTSILPPISEQPTECWRAGADAAYHGYAIKFGNPEYECIISAPDIATLKRVWITLSGRKFEESKVYRVGVMQERYV